jgi:hypothetical protein
MSGAVGDVLGDMAKKQKAALDEVAALRNEPNAAPRPRCAAHSISRELGITPEFNSLSPEQKAALAELLRAKAGPHGAH